MQEQIVWIILAMILVVGVMAVTAVVLVAGRRRQEDDRYPASPVWEVELWNIGHRYQVGLCFVNTCILGRLTLCEHTVGDCPPVMDRTISREHCMLIEQNGMLLAWNMSAVNPTRLNGHRLNEPAQLMPGDRLELGDSAFLVTRIEHGYGF